MKQEKDLLDKFGLKNNWKKLANSSLNKQNEFIFNCLERISFNYFDNTHAIPLLNSYQKESDLVTGIDELKAMNFCIKKTNEQKFDKEFDYKEESKNWIETNYEDVYSFKITYEQIVNAFKDSESFENIINSFIYSIENQSGIKWYDRIIETHKKYKINYPIDLSKKEKNITDYKYIITKIDNLMKDLVNPNMNYNLDKQIKSVLIKDQQLIFNNNWIEKMQFEYPTRLLSEPEFEDAILVNYNDDNMIAVLDTAKTVFIKREQHLLAMKNCIDDGLFEYHYYENHKVAINPSQISIIIKTV